MRRVALWTACILAIWVGWALFRSGYLLMGDPVDDPFRDPRDASTGIRWMIQGALLVIIPVLSVGWMVTRRWRRGQARANERKALGRPRM
jgi:hypothetical protein